MVVPNGGGAHMKGREFIKLASRIPLAWPIASRAQQPDRMRRIGVLLPFAENDPEAQDRLMAFRQGLEKVGWAEGRNLRIEHRFAAGSSERMRAFAKELVGLKPDMILASGTPVLVALQHQASTYDSVRDGS
jgi:putative tryptophan/tyrosine transport system substrate-binding protein